MILPPPRSTRTDTPFPSTTLFRSPLNAVKLHVGIATDIIVNGKSQITGHQRRAETGGKTALLAVTHLFGRGREIVGIGDDSLCDGGKSFAVHGCKSLKLGGPQPLDPEHQMIAIATVWERGV